MSIPSVSQRYANALGDFLGEIAKLGRTRLIDIPEGRQILHDLMAPLPGPPPPPTYGLLNQQQPIVPELPVQENSDDFFCQLCAKLYDDAEQTSKFLFDTEELQFTHAQTHLDQMAIVSARPLDLEQVAAMCFSKSNPEETEFSDRNSVFTDDGFINEENSQWICPDAVPKNGRDWTYQDTWPNYDVNGRDSVDSSDNGENSQDPVQMLGRMSRKYGIDGQKADFGPNYGVDTEKGTSSDDLPKNDNGSTEDDVPEGLGHNFMNSVWNYGRGKRRSSRGSANGSETKAKAKLTGLEQRRNSDVKTTQIVHKEQSTKPKPVRPQPQPKFLKLIRSIIQSQASSDPGKSSYVKCRQCDFVVFISKPKPKPEGHSPLPQYRSLIDYYSRFFDESGLPKQFRQKTWLTLVSTKSIMKILEHAMDHVGDKLTYRCAFCVSQGKSFVSDRFSEIFSHLPEHGARSINLKRLNRKMDALKSMGRITASLGKCFGGDSSMEAGSRLSAENGIGYGKSHGQDRRFEQLKNLDHDQKEIFGGENRSIEKKKLSRRRKSNLLPGSYSGTMKGFLDKYCPGTVERCTPTSNVLPCNLCKRRLTVYCGNSISIRLITHSILHFKRMPDVDHRYRQLMGKQPLETAEMITKCFGKRSSTDAKK